MSVVRMSCNETRDATYSRYNRERKEDQLKELQVDLQIAEMENKLKKENMEASVLQKKLRQEELKAEIEIAQLEEQLRSVKARIEEKERQEMEDKKLKEEQKEQTERENKMDELLLEQVKEFKEFSAKMDRFNEEMERIQKKMSSLQKTHEDKEDGRAGQTLEEQTESMDQEQREQKSTEEESMEVECFDCNFLHTPQDFREGGCSIVCPKCCGKTYIQRPKEGFQWVYAPICRHYQQVKKGEKAMSCAEYCKNINCCCKLNL